MLNASAAGADGDWCAGSPSPLDANKWKVNEVAVQTINTCYIRMIIIYLLNYAILSSFNISNQILHFSIVFLFLINIITADNLTMAQRKLADFISTNLRLNYKYTLHKSQIILLLYLPSAVQPLHLLHPSAKSNVFPNSQPMPFN